jgi:hypothetical protein
LPGSLYGNASLPGTQEGLHPNLIAAYVAIHFLQVADAYETPTHAGKQINGSTTSPFTCSSVFGNEVNQFVQYPLVMQLILVNTGHKMSILLITTK